jgi:hypothetical protein
MGRQNIPNLDVVVEMASYDPFEMRTQQGAHTKGANTLRPTQYSREVNLTAEIVQNVLEILQWEMASMHA